MADIKKIKVGDQQKYLRTADEEGNTTNIILRPQNLQLSTSGNNLGSTQAFMGYFFALPPPPSSSQTSYTCTITIDFASKPFYGFDKQLKIMLQATYSSIGSGLVLTTSINVYYGYDNVYEASYTNNIPSIYIGIDTQFNLIFKQVSGEINKMDTTSNSVIIEERGLNQVIEALADNYIVPTDGVVGWENIWSQNSDDDFHTTAGTGYVYQDGLRYDL